MADAQETPQRVGPRQVEAIENVWIPMSDGIRLAARLWLPVDAERNPVPALLEYIPYRKRDSTRLRDESAHPYLASHGYACIRVDIRGSGDSDGLPQDEYIKQEQDDGLEIIAWLTAQPWCTGKVGMFGVSWGGFSALQVAARRPPALKAIITVCSTDDRYSDGDQWMGGCIEETFFTWGASATLNGARPPDPAIVGDGWRETWMRRLQALEFHLGTWFEHQHRDAYWNHASVSQEYGAIECAVYAVCGWADHFNSTVSRMLARLHCPRKGLIGPWNHAYPHLSALRPTIDWLSEALRWWDHWLKGIDTGIMDEPMFRVWMQHTATMRGMNDVPGHWVAEETWPSPAIAPLTYHLTDEALSPREALGFERCLAPIQTVGVTAPARYYRTDRLDITLPGDQRIDDVRSLTFDSAPLTDDVAILGAPVAELDLAVDRPVALLSARLNEVEADGCSNRLSFGMLNLTHRDSDESPEPLVPGRRTRIRIQLHDCAQRIARGNRIRLSLSTAYWPAFWPSPEPVTLTVFSGQLHLPRRPPRDLDRRLRPFGPGFVPQTSGKTTLVAASPPASTYEWDAVRRTLTIRNGVDSGRWRLDATGTEMTAAWSEVTEISDRDPSSARLDLMRSESFARDRWNVRVEAKLRLRLTRTDFLVGGEIRALEHDRDVFQRSWDRKIPRRLL
jgi:putative CocE/NonD family hydrolase